MHPAPNVNGNASLRESEGALLHLGGHEIEGVGAGGSEVFFQAGSIHKTHICGENGIWGFAVEDINEQRDHTFGNERIRIGLIIDEAIGLLRIQPDLRLAAPDQMLGIAGILGEYFKLFAEADYIFVSFRPVLEKLQVLDQALLFLFDSAHWKFLLRKGAQVSGNIKPGSGGGREALKQTTREKCEGRKNDRGDEHGIAALHSP